MDIQDPQKPEPEVIPELQNPEPEVMPEQEPEASKRVFQQTEDFPTLTQAAREQSLSEKEFGRSFRDTLGPMQKLAWTITGPNDGEFSALAGRAALTTITGNAYLKSQAPDFVDDAAFAWTDEYYAKVMTGIADDEQPWIRDSSSEAEVQWKREAVIARMRNEMKLAEYGFEGAAIRLLADLSDPIFLAAFGVGGKFAQAMIGARTITAGRVAQARGRYNQVLNAARAATATTSETGLVFRNFAHARELPFWEAQAWASKGAQAEAAALKAAHKIMVQPTILERSIISGAGFGTTELARAHVNPLIHDDDILHAIGAGMVFGAGHGVVNKIWQKFMHAPPVYQPFESSKWTRPMEPRGGGPRGGGPSGPTVQGAFPTPPRLLPHPDVVIPPLKPRGPLALPEARLDMSETVAPNLGTASNPVLGKPKIGISTGSTPVKDAGETKLGTPIESIIHINRWDKNNKLVKVWSGRVHHEGEILEDISGIRPTGEGDMGGHAAHVKWDATPYTIPTPPLRLGAPKGTVAPKAPIPTSTDTFVGLPNGTIVKVPHASVDYRTALKSWEILNNLSPKIPMSEALNILKSKGVTKNEIAFVGSDAAKDLQNLTTLVEYINKGEYVWLSNSIEFPKLLAAYPKQAEDIKNYRHAFRTTRAVMPERDAKFPHDYSPSKLDSIVVQRLKEEGIAPLKLPLPKSKLTVQDLINDYSVPILDVEVYSSAIEGTEKTAELKALDMRRDELIQAMLDAENIFKSDTNELIKAWFTENITDPAAIAAARNVEVAPIIDPTSPPSASIARNIEWLKSNTPAQITPTWLKFSRDIQNNESFKISELNHREATEALNAFGYSEKVAALKGPEETQAAYGSNVAFTGVDRTREVLLRATGDMFYMEGHFTGKKSLQLTDRGKNAVAHGRWGFEVGSEKKAVAFEIQSANQNDLAVDRKEGRTSAEVEKRQMLAATWIAHTTQSMIISMVKNGARQLRFADYNEVIAKSSQSTPKEAKGRHIYDVAVPSYLEKYSKALGLNLRTRLADKDAVEPAIFDTIKESFEAAGIADADVADYINLVKMKANISLQWTATHRQQIFLDRIRDSIPNYTELAAQTDFNSLASLYRTFLEAKMYTQRTLHLTEYDAKRILESEGLFINPFVNKKGTLPKPKPRGEYALAIHDINLVYTQEQIDSTGLDLRQPSEIMADNPLLLDTSSLEGLSMAELRKIAEPLGVKGRSKLDLTAKIEVAREAEPKLYEPPTDLRPVLVPQSVVDNFPEIVNETGFVIVTDAVAAAAAALKAEAPATTGAGTPPPTVPPSADGTTPPPAEPAPEEPLPYEATMALLSRIQTAGMMPMRELRGYSWSFSANLGKPNAPLVLRFFHQDAIQTLIAGELDGKTVPVGYAADMKADAYTKIDLTNVGELEGGAFDEWYLANKERFPLIGGVDGIRVKAAQSEFYDLVFRGIEGEKVTDPLVQRSVDAFTEGYRVQAEAILKSGMSETLLNHEGYATRSWKTGKLGRNITLYTLDKMTELFNMALIDKNPTFTPRQSSLIAKSLLINVNARGLDVDYESTNGVGEESYEAMKRKLSAIPNITEEEIAIAMKALDKGPYKPSYLKNRTELNVFASMKMRNEETGELDDVSIIDMLDTNVKASFIHHTRRLRGQIAYRELGKEFNKYRGLSADAPHATWDDMKAILKRELLERGENNAHALELFEHTQRVVLGIPIDPSTTRVGDAARMLQKTALTAFGVSFGLAAFAEAGQAIAMTSTDSMERMAPEIWQLFQDVFSGNMPTGELARELQGFVGMAPPKWGRGTNMNREFDHILENSQGSLESFLDFAGEKALSLGGLFAMDTAQRYIAMMGFTDTIVNGVMDGGISPYSEILEKQIGWTPDMIYRIGKMMLVHGKLYDAVGGGKKIGRAHPELWEDIEAAEQFRWGGNLFTMRTIHTSQKGQYHHKFQGQLGRMFWQFRTFMLSAYEGQAVTAVQGMQHGDKRAAIALVTNSIFAGLSYIGTILVRYGHDEEKLKKYLTKEQILKGMLFKSGWFTIGAPITDTVLQLLGEDKVFSYAGTRSGLASDALMGSPSIAIANALAGTGKSLLAPVFNPSYQYSKQDWRHIKTLAPLHGLLGWGNALDAVPKFLDLPDSSAVKE